MLAWLLGAALGVPQFVLGLPDGPPVAPTDIVPGHQRLDLRAPLVARTPGARLVLFVRQFDGRAASRAAGFESAVPAGSVTARLRERDGGELVLEHTGYTYYRGFAGLVLTEREPGPGNALYDRLEIDADVALPDVRFMWLDQDARTVRDVPGPGPR